MIEDVAFREVSLSSVKRSEGWFNQRRMAGEYNLFCDDQAALHYGTSVSGLSYRVWRIRIYLNGFFSRLTY